MGGCVFTVSPRPSDSSDNPHIPAGGEQAATGSRSAIQSLGHRAIWVVQSSQRVTHTRSHVTASLIRGCPLFQMRESGLLLGWTTPSPSVARTRTMYSPGFAGAKWYFHTVQT
jgi:hypothetical protein